MAQNSSTDIYNSQILNPNYFGNPATFYVSLL